MRPASTTTPGGVSVSLWLPLDPYATGANDGLYAKVTGAATYSVEVTPDDVFDTTVTPTAFPCGIAALTAVAANGQGALAYAARAVRVNQTAGAGTVKLTAVVRGVP